MKKKKKGKKNPFVLFSSPYTFVMSSLLVKIASVSGLPHTILIRPKCPRGSDTHALDITHGVHLDGGPQLRP
jgi:hypothetical protein